MLYFATTQADGCGGNREGGESVRVIKWCVFHGSLLTGVNEAPFSTVSSATTVTYIPNVSL